MLSIDVLINKLNNINPPSIYSFFSGIDYFLGLKKKKLLTDEDKQKILKSRIRINFTSFNSHAFTEVSYILFYNNIKLHGINNKYPIILNIKSTSSSHGHKGLIARIDKNTLITGGVIQNNKFVRYSDEWSSRVSYDGRYLGEFINDCFLKVIGI